MRRKRGSGKGSSTERVATSSFLAGREEGRRRDTTLYTVSPRTVFLGARAHTKRAYHRAVATRLVRRVILISAHDLIASRASGNGERERESGLFMCTGRKRREEDEKREREKERKVEGRISRDAGTFLSSRSTISSSGACDDRLVGRSRKFRR